MSEGHEGDTQGHRHLGLLQVNRSLMLQMWGATPEGHWFRVTEGVPSTARFVSAWYDHERLVYRFMWEDDSFPPVAENVRVEHTILPIMYARIERPEGEQA